MKKQKHPKKTEISLFELKEKNPQLLFQLILFKHIEDHYKESPYIGALASLTKDSISESCLFSFLKARREKASTQIRLVLEKVLTAYEDKSVRFSEENIKTLFSSSRNASILNEWESHWPRALTVAVKKAAQDAEQQRLLHTEALANFR